jgi:aryl-alcohol dehydrogenase
MSSAREILDTNGCCHKARAAVVRPTSRTFDIEDVSLDDPRDDEVLVRLVATGVCHTDLIARDQVYPVPQPIVLGHEGAGIVEKVGAGVTHVEPGDHVVLTYLSCGDCPACRDGSPAYCHELFGLCFGGSRADGSSAIRDAHGEALHGHFFGQSSFATLAIAHRRSVVKVRRDAPLHMLGPLGCGLQTGAGAVLNVLRPKKGESLAVFGAGAVGLSAVMAARHLGAGPIIVIDVLPERLQIARDLGADLAIDAREGSVVEQIQAASGGGVNFALEATGIVAVVRQAIDALGPRGVCGIVGATAPGEEAKVDIADLMVRGKTIRGIVEGDSVPETLIPQLVDLYLSGDFPIDRLVRTYPFDAIAQAVADAESGAVIKPVLLMA